MAKLKFQRIPTKWGNGYGIRLTRRDFDRMGTEPGRPLRIEMRPASMGVDLSKLHILRGPKTASVDHTELSTEA